MSSNDRHGRQSLGSDGPAHGDANSLLDAIFNLSQGGQRPGLDGGAGTGEASQLLLPFSQQQPGLSSEAAQGRQSLEELHRTSFQTPLNLPNLPSFPNFSNLPSLPNLHNFPPQQPQAAPFNPFSLNIPPAPFNSPARGPASLANSPLYSTSLPSLASPPQSTTNNKLNNLRLAIATRDPTESVEDVLSPRSLSFLHSHFQSMGVELPASASWGQIQQLLGQPRTPRSSLQTSSSMFSERGLGLPPQETSPSLLSSFPAQDNVQWNIPPPPPPGSGESVLDRFLATVNLPANETNARITKLAANLILQQQQQQQEQQRLLRQQQIRQLQESFHLHSQIPSLPTFQQQPGHHPPSLANFGSLGGNVSLGGGLLNPSQDPSAQGSPIPSLPGLPKLTPQMTELWQSALSKENQGSLNAFLNTQKFAAATAHQLGRGGLQSPGYSVPDQVAQVIVGQQQTSPQRVQALSTTQGGGSSEQGRQGHQNLSSLVAPLTSDAMRRALMAGGALSAQPAETSMGGSLSQGSIRTGKRGLSFRTESQYPTETSMEEASAESTPTDRKRQRQGNSPAPSSRISYGAIPRAPTFNNRVSQVTIPPLPPTPALQFQLSLPLPTTALVPGIARPAKPPGGNSPAQYSFPSPARNEEQKGQALAEAKGGAAQSVGRGADVDKARGETPVKLNRAKRGQATDPHSVAERIRRDKITEKMRQLESLVPHRHKMDKASMLEEIIEYVKFMQLQVQVLSIGSQDTAQSVRETLPGGLPDIATRRGRAPPGKETAATAAVAAPQVAAQLQRSPEQAVRFLLDQGLCLVPAHLAAKLIEFPPEVLKQKSAAAPAAPRVPASTASLLASPMTVFPSETEGARAPAAVFSGWEEEEERAAEIKNKMREEDAREVANAIQEQEQRETRSESGLASSPGVMGGAYKRPQTDEEQGVDQLTEMDSGQDFDAMSPGLGEGLDLPGFGKTDSVHEAGHMAAMWDSDPHE